MKEEQYWILISKKISGEASAEELEQLQALLACNPGWKTIEENLQELWNSKPIENKDNNLHIAEVAYLLHINRLKEHDPEFASKEDIVEIADAYYSKRIKKPLYKSWTTYATAAVVIMLIFFIPFISGKKNKNETAGIKDNNEIIVKPGVKTKLQLPDGSHVWLNSNSKLSYSETFNGPLREVFLTGEGYFDVVKNATRPFIVHTNGIDIKVLGTVFNVKAYDSDATIEATLVHGLIEVTKTNQPNTSKVILKPYEKLIYSKVATTQMDKPGYQKSSNISEEVKGNPAIIISQLANNRVNSEIVETSWVYNRLSFEDEKFDDIAVKMERWFNVKITINNEKIKSYKLTGSFEDETVEEALKELEYLVSFSYKISGRNIDINKK